MYRIVSLSGGGVRGLITAHELAPLTAQELSKVDCFAGTSTGGILALGAAAGFTFYELEDLYRHWIPTIFQSRGWFDRIWKLDEVRRANYDNKGLIKACRNVFGDLKMSDLLADVVVPSVCLDGVDPDNGVRCAQTVWYTRTMPNANKIPIWEVAVKTSSAPVYFPSYKGFVDGGLSMNNPAAKAVQVAYNSGIPVEAMDILVVTTGSSPLYERNKRTDWGLAQWCPNIISLILRLQEQSSLDLLHLHGLGHYGVADYALAKNISMDDVRWAEAFGPDSYTKRPVASKAIEDFRTRLRGAT